MIVFPEHVNDNWWRKEGHKLQVEDLDEILEHETEPEVIVLGTGYYGLVKTASEVRDLLNSRGIELISQPTSDAVQTYNKLLRNNSMGSETRNVVIGAFHLTC